MKKEYITTIILTVAYFGTLYFASQFQYEIATIHVFQIILSGYIAISFAIKFIYEK